MENTNIRDTFHDKESYEIYLRKLIPDLSIFNVAESFLSKLIMDTSNNIPNRDIDNENTFSISSDLYFFIKIKTNKNIIPKCCNGARRMIFKAVPTENEEAELYPVILNGVEVVTDKGNIVKNDDVICHKMIINGETYFIVISNSVLDLNFSKGDYFIGVVF